MKTKPEIVKDWLPRYTGRPLDQFESRSTVTPIGAAALGFGLQADCHLIVDALKTAAKTVRLP